MHAKVERGDVVHYVYHPREDEERGGLHLHVVQCASESDAKGKGKGSKGAGHTVSNPGVDSPLLEDEAIGQLTNHGHWFLCATIHADVG